MYASFDEYWTKTWDPMKGQPEIMNLAFREVAEKAWNAAKEQIIGQTDSQSVEDYIKFYDSFDFNLLKNVDPN
jgi:hypothetical protein